jgi:hypothetical protein
MSNDVFLLSPLHALPLLLWHPFENSIILPEQRPFIADKIVLSIILSPLPLTI